MDVTDSQDDWGWKAGVEFIYSCPLPFVLSLSITEESLAPSSLEWTQSRLLKAYPAASISQQHYEAMELPHLQTNILKRCGIFTD